MLTSMKHFLVLGSNPLLSLAEAKAVIGERKPVIAGNLAIFDVEAWDGKALQNILAGTIKLGDILFEGPIADLTAEHLADLIDALPRGDRVLFGLTVFGPNQSTFKNLPILLKRTLVDRGRSVRWVTGEKGELTPAAVEKVHLTTKGYDIVVASFGQTAIVGLTTHVQSASAWSYRDFSRPFRDATTGMLPPKLAHIMVNLTRKEGKLPTTLLDPFCGGGTVMMEAALLGITAQTGSDMDAKQIAGSKENLDWLMENGLLKDDVRAGISLLVSPVASLNRDLPPASFDAVVTEGFLGKPLRGHENAEFLQHQKREIEDLWYSALQTVARLLRPGSRLTVVWPRFKTATSDVAVDLRNELEALGYRMIDPLAGWTERREALVYARPDQFVKRQIVVLERK